MEALPLIVTAQLDPDTQDGLDGLRRRHFPPERNHLAAHLTLFHHLDGARCAEVEGVLAEAAQRLPLVGTTTEPRHLGRGVAVGVDSPELVELRAWIAHRVPGPLTKQDRGWGWPHVTVQNKVSPQAARDLLAVLAADLDPQPLEVIGLRLWRYLGGPWEPVSGFPG